MEDGEITISRASGRVLFPSKFMLVAAQNPCPCGFYGDKTKECKCNLNQILRYQKRVSGPMLDRIDIHLDVPAVKTEKLVSNEKNLKAETSKEIRKRVQKARDMQLKRFSAKGGSSSGRKYKITSNAEMSTRDVKEFCVLSPESLEILRLAVERMNLSARSYFRTIKIARTIADLEQSIKIKPVHIAEALQYRPKQESI